MAQNTVSSLAADLKLPVEEILTQLKNAGRPKLVMLTDRFCWIL